MEFLFVCRSPQAATHFISKMKEEIFFLKRLVKLYDEQEKEFFAR